MSTHDRGAFGALLAEAKALGVPMMSFDVNLSADDESDKRWICWLPHDNDNPDAAAQGRTGEEALRRLVEKLRTNRNSVASSKNGA